MTWRNRENEQGSIVENPPYRHCRHHSALLKSVSYELPLADTGLKVSMKR
jgi:hypothetical protein